MIALSLYGKSDDRLWFSFFHEAGHVVLHGRREGFLETDRPSESHSTEGTDTKDAKEEAADQFARDFLIPPAEYTQIASTHRNSRAVISRFATSMGIAAGIVVGRLQHDGYLPRSYCNDLKVPLAWSRPEPS
jgi:Zn-dependent peptidase ImmA (M78 family)